MGRPVRRMKAAMALADGAGRAPEEVNEAEAPWAIERVFGAARPASPRRGLEPAFVLFESRVMAGLRRRAAARGLAYDALVRLIVRDHLDEY